MTAPTDSRNPADRIVAPDPWADLTRFTDARIGLGRCGSSLPLAESLKFKLAHAQARDAVHQPFRIDELAAELEAAGHPNIQLSSAVTDRGEYLTRPDKGRMLDGPSRALLEGRAGSYDLCLVVADGLSARAVHESAFGFSDLFLRLMVDAPVSMAPVCLVQNGRVAVADEIAHTLKAKLAVILIGERPGLSSPNSLGVYMTYSPKPGTTDEARNCISNVRPGGMTIEQGVRKLAYLVEQALVISKSGVELKDKMAPGHLPFGLDPAALTTAEE